MIVAMWRGFGLLVGVTMVAGCASRPAVRDARLDLHAVRFDGDGRTIDLLTGAARDASATKAQFDRILDAMDAEMTDRRTRKILLFVHGGLNKPVCELRGCVSMRS